MSRLASLTQRGHGASSHDFSCRGQQPSREVKLTITQACTTTQPRWEGCPATKGGRCPALSPGHVLTRSCYTWTSSSSRSTSCSSTSLRNATWFPLPFCTRRSLTTLALRRACPRCCYNVRVLDVGRLWCAPHWCQVPGLLPVPSFLRLYSTVGFPNAVLLHSCLHGGQVGTQITY